MQIRSTTRIDHVSGVKKVNRCQLSLYKTPPQDEITLDEFELLALDRLQLLRGIESLKMRGFDGEDYSNKASQLEKKYVPFNGMKTEERKDQISHFILRLAFCRTEELRRWFITQECHLFRLRFERLTDLEQSEFMAANNLKFESLSNEMKLNRQGIYHSYLLLTITLFFLIICNDYKDELIGLAGVDEIKFHNTSFYKYIYI